jgi:phage terminase Nu1 subunit (DNA packaging protein)
LDHYPQLTPAQLHDAISYYYDHQAEIAAEIREHELSDEELARLQAQWPPQSST